MLSSLLAQTGLYEISYQDDYQPLHDRLIRKGFIRTQLTQNKAIYINHNIPHLLALTLAIIPESKKVGLWSIIYLTGRDPDLVLSIVDELVAIHQEEPTYNEPIDEYYWQFNENRSLILSFDSESKILNLIYYDTEHEELIF